MQSCFHDVRTLQEVCWLRNLAKYLYTGCVLANKACQLCGFREFEVEFSILNDRECFLPLIGMTNVDFCLVNSGALVLELLWKKRDYNFVITIGLLC